MFGTGSTSPHGEGRNTTRQSPNPESEASSRNDAVMRLLNIHSKYAVLFRKLCCIDVIFGSNLIIVRTKTNVVDLLTVLHVNAIP